MQALRHFLLAVQFFSRIPVQGRLAAWAGWSPELQRASAAHLPGVGWLVGAWAAIWLYAIAWLLPGQPWVPLIAAAVSTAATLWLTGGFHEDGLADVADGLGGFVPQARALEIMKDSRVGAYGVMALVMALLTKVALVAGLVAIYPPLAAVIVLCSHVLSRLAPLALMRALPYVGLHASSKTVNITGKQLGWSGWWTGVLWCLPAAALVAWWASTGALLVMLTMGSFTTWRMGRWLRQRLGGMTGDCLGACQQVVELALLLAALVAIAQFTPAL